MSFMKDGGGWGTGVVVGVTTVALVSDMIYGV